MGCILGYQWRLDGVPIAGATSATLELSSLTPEQLGDYDCLVTHSMGSLLTQTATLDDGGAATIEIEPLDRLVEIGEPTSFELTSADAVAFQWFHQNQAIPGAVAPLLNLAETTLADLGTYYCEVTSTCGNIAISAVVELNLRGILAAGLDRTHALGLGELALDPRLMGNPGHVGWTWYGPEGLPLPSAQPQLLVEPTVTSVYRVEAQDELTLETVTAETRVLVALDPKYRDYDQDGDNTTGDLHAVASQWLHPGANDANGDGVLNVRDMLYIQVRR